MYLNRKQKLKTMLKKLLLVLLLSIPFASFGQQHVLFRDSTTIDSFRLTMWVRQLIPPAVPKINPFFDSLGSAYLAPNGIWWRHNGVVWQPLTTEPDSAVWATRYYVDSGLTSISAGAVDTNNYISSIARLNREIDSVSNITDSLYTVMATKQGADSLLLALRIDTANFQISEAFIEIDNIQNEFVNVYDSLFLLDSALGVAFGAISELYDTLPNYVPYTGATGNVDIGTHTFTAKDGVFNHSSGSGTTLSVTKGGAGEALTVNKTSGSGNAMSVTGGVTLLDELHTTTQIADAYIASAATWNAKGTVSSIQLVAGTGVTITPTTAVTTAGVYTISATGGGGGGSPTLATPYELLYQSGTDTIKTTPKVYVDTTDNRLVLAYDSTNSTVVADPNGGTKVFGSNRMGMSSIRILDTVSIPAALQRSINMQITSVLIPNTTILNGTGNYLVGAPSSIMTGASTTNVVGSYNSTIQHLNYTKLIITSGIGANLTVGIRTNSNLLPLGLICGNTKFSAGGGRGTLMGSFPSFDIGQRIYIGYTSILVAGTSDPSVYLSAENALGVGKDAADTELYFYHSNNVTTPTKVATGITPNSEDVYVVTVYVAPNSTYYIQLEVRSKTGSQVVTYNPTTNVPPISTKIFPRHWINNAATGVAISYGFIQATEEIY
jgi:hypothetical protein